MYIFDIIPYNLDFVQFLNIIFPVFFIISYYFISRRIEPNKWLYILIYFVNIALYEMMGWAYFYFDNKGSIVLLMYIFIALASMTLLMSALKPDIAKGKRNVIYILAGTVIILAALRFAGLNIMIIIISVFTIICNGIFVFKSLKRYDIHKLSSSDRVELWLFFTIVMLNCIILISSNRLLWLMNIDYYAFFLSTGVSQYSLRTILYTVLFVELLVLYLRIAGRTFSGKALRSYTLFIYLNIVIFSVLTITGFLIVNISGENREKEMRNTLLAKAETAAAAILPHHIEGFRAEGFAYESDYYNILKDILHYIQKKNADIRFAYIYYVIDGKMVFIADSEPDSSEDFLAPGTVDSMELPQGEIDNYENGISYVDGPFFDEWGVWITASAPIRDYKNNVIAAIGIDTDAYKWYRSMLFARHVPLVSFIFLDLLYFFAVVTMLVLRRSYMELSVSEEKYRTLFEKSKNAIFILGMDGTVIDANLQAKYMLKMEHRNIIGTAFEEYLSRSGTIDYYNIFINYISFARSLPINVNMVNADNLEIPVEISAFNVSIENRRVIFVIVYNLSQIKKIEGEKNKLEEQLHQMEKMDALGHMAGGIAHDFNNILTIVQGNAELISAKSENAIREYALKIADASNRAKMLTRELLSFARKAQYQIVPVDLEKLAADSLKLLKSSMGGNIYIKSAFNARNAIVMGDISQLQNMFFNIAINAKDAMPDGGTFSVHLKNTIMSNTGNEHEYVVISFTDTGIGMDSEVQKHIFEPFYTTKERGRGTGLGLSSVFGTVQKHNGFIEVQSSPLKGSTFDIYLPVTDRGKDVSHEHSNSYNEHGCSILFVDDEEYIRLLARDFLEPLHNVVLKKNGFEAIEYYKKHHDDIDIVIMDMIMPGMNGSKTLKQMRDIKPCFKAIIISGYSINNNADKFTDESIVGFIQKPFGKKELLDVIQSNLPQF